MRAALIWIGLAIILIAPLGAAAFSPLLAWRDPIYIGAGFAGIVAMALLVVQPLLAANFLPPLSLRTTRRVHGWVGVSVLGAVVVHVLGLWITSPPDVVDALLLMSPTPFSAWGVGAMWALFATAILVWLRRRGTIRWRVWRMGHVALGLVIVIGTILHALLIDGTMETVTKIGLCICLACALLALIWRIRSPG